MAGEAPHVPEAISPAGLRFLVPTNYVVDGLDPEVAAAFERACAQLMKDGARLTKQKVPAFDELGAANAKGGFPAAEAYAWHASLLAARGADYDPRVRVRIERGREMLAADYIRLVDERRRIVASFNAMLAPFDALLMPTVAKLAPPVAAFAPEGDYARLNAMILRNPAAVNFVDGCAATVPIQRAGELAVGLSIVGAQGSDARLLRIALGVEAAVVA
jgi:aspartyl-tRNA(Asn)/glutamyl-tRNA(Gln) amidotransferase subunit A